MKTTVLVLTIFAYFTKIDEILRKIPVKVNKNRSNIHKYV